MMKKNSNTSDSDNKKKLSPTIILGIVSLVLIILSITIMIIGTSMISKGKTIKLFFCERQAPLVISVAAEIIFGAKIYIYFEKFFHFAYIFSKKLYFS